MVNLLEEIVLLAYDDDKGVNNSGSDLDLGMGGVALMDLVLRDRISVMGDQIVVIDESPLGDTVLDDILQQLTTSEPRTPARWSRQLGRGLAKRVRDDMVDQGLLRLERGKALGMFGYNRYLPTDPAVEREVRQRLDNAARLGRADGDRTAALAAAVLALRIEKTALPDMPWGKGRAALKAVSRNCSDPEVDAGIRATRESLNAALNSIAAVLGVSIVLGVMDGE